VPVLEHSVTEFIERFKHHAARVTLYPQTEASPLLEARVGGRVVYLFDRVGPYSAKAGEALVIVNPMSETVFRTDAEESLTINGVSSIEGVGQVLETQQGYVVVQARAPLVVGVLDDSWKHAKVGDRVAFSSVDAVHGFYLKAVTTPHSGLQID
jgi:hypothetical protein